LRPNTPLGAQTKGKIPKVGILEPGPSAAKSATANVCESGFRRGIGELGYLEGRNILFEARYGEYNADRLRDIGADLLRAAPEVIWTHLHLECWLLSSRRQSLRTHPNKHIEPQHFLCRNIVLPLIACVLPLL
jgi:hypothetical protein